MSYTGADSAELLALRSGFASLSIEAAVIQQLSARIRSITESNGQNQAVQLWTSQLLQCNSTQTSRILAFFYLANDVVQLLRGDAAQVSYKYLFLPALGEAIYFIRKTAPTILSKVIRVLQIFSERRVFDQEALHILNQCLSENESSVVINELKKFTDPSKLSIVSFKIDLEEQLQRQQANTLLTKSLVAPVFICPPTLEELLEAGNVLDTYLKQFPGQRSSAAINSDAEIVSRIRGYRVPQNAPMAKEDAHLIAMYDRLLELNKTNRLGIEEKVKRRQYEEDNAQYSFFPTDSHTVNASNKVQILMKKEWNLRLEKQQINYAIYWYLITLMKHLMKRWNELHILAEMLDNEIKRRKEIKSTAIDEDTAIESTSMN